MSSISRSENLSQLGDWFGLLEAKVRREGFLGHYDLNREIEYVFRDLFNFAYGWDLENSNNVFKKNQEAFDLSSATGSLCVQVTTTQDAAKIKNTLIKFVPNYRDRFERLAFIYPVMEMKKSKASFTKESGGFDFKPGRDRLCLQDLMDRAQEMTAAKQGEFLKLVESELAPLGKAIRLGTELSVGLLIAVIAHMASYGTPQQMSHRESMPDDDRKLARFQEHAVFLKRQFSLNREYYIPVQEARKAVGIDAASVLRIQLWLKSNSLDLLEEHSGDARAAFEALAERLLQETHQSGHNADVTAVRYLLADEFFRCNVFPNPE